jgi:antitoxin (DNA-binding transcriptional repressor) of toxin-antitoxin stability system
VTTGGHFEDMRTIGVKQLKARLSEFLRAVRAGETILVTDRDQVVAELSPPRRVHPRSDELADTLEQLSDAGEVTLPGPTKSSGWSSRGAGLPTGTAARLLDEIRGDR